MPPNQSRSTSAREDRADQRRRLDLLRPRGRASPAPRRRQRDRLLAAREDAAASRDQRLVVIGPGGARQAEHPLPLLPALRRIGIGIEEDVAVIEGGDQLDRLGEQHAVAEHVAGHVADAGDPDRLLLHVDAQLAEVALDGDPGALGGDPHRLVVVAVRAAAGEGVAEPEAALDRDRVGDVGEGRRALVGGDDEIGVVAVMDRSPGPDGRPCRSTILSVTESSERMKMR